ncbi:MAG: hypothetical protein JWO06_2006 [Bacteroidota bacterium]|nr:hypothetical protein [Bacteroidota bacterium]
MNKRVFVLATVLLIPSLTFASGHLPDLGPILAAIALFLLGTWGTSVLGLIFSLRYRSKGTNTSRSVAWVFGIQSLAVELYLLSTSLFKDDSGFGSNDLNSLLLYAFIIPLCVSLGSIFLLVTANPQSIRRPEYDEFGAPLQYADQPTNQRIKAFRAFVFIVYSYKLIQTLIFFVTMIRYGFIFHIGHDNGPHTAYFQSNILLTLNMVISFLFLFYGPAILYFLVKRSKWCWVLLFADSLIAGISIVFAFGSLAISSHSLNFMVIAVILEVALLYFIWLDEVAAYLNISREEKMKYSIAVSIGGMVLVAARVLVWMNM